MVTNGLDPKGSGFIDPETDRRGITRRRRRRGNPAPLAWAALPSVVLASQCAIAQANESARDAQQHHEHAAARRAITAVDIVQLKVIGGQTGDGLSVSPDGRLMAFEMHQADLERNTYRAEWIVHPTSGGGTAVSVGDAGDPLLFRLVDDSGLNTGAWVSPSPRWSADSRWVFYRRQVNGEVQIWRSSVDGKRQEQLTHNDADIEQFEVTADGLRLLMAVDAPRVAKAAWTAGRAAEGHLFDTAGLWSRFHGTPVYARYASTGGEPRIWTLEPDTLLERPATTEEADEYWSITGAGARRIAAFGQDAREVIDARDKQSVAWLAPAYPDQRGLSPPLTLYASRSPDGKEAIKCTHAACTGRFPSAISRERAWWSENLEEVHVVRAEGPNFGRRTWYAWNVERNRVRMILRTDVDWISSCSVVGKRAICFREEPDYPRTVIAIELQNGKIETLYDPNPDFRGLSVGKWKRMEWNDGRGHATSGILVTPPGARAGVRHPLIIVGYRPRGLIHGGTGDEYPVHLFATRGFAVLVYDHSEAWDIQAVAEDAADATRRVWGADLLEATVPLSLVEAAVELLDRQKVVDAKRVGLTGFSTGAHLVNYALVNSNRVAAAVVSQPAWSPLAYYLAGGGSGGRRALRSMGLGPIKGADARSWQRLSPALNVDSVDAPLLINASDDEYHSGMETVASFEDAGKPIVEMHVYPGEYHVKWYPRHRHSIYERNVDWFNFWLSGVEDPTADKATQYQRWREMKTVLQRTRVGSP